MVNFFWTFLSTSRLQMQQIAVQVVADMSKEERCALMKFATSVSRAPLGGFKHLNPPLTVHKVGGSFVSILQQV